MKRRYVVILQLLWIELGYFCRRRKFMEVKVGNVLEIESVTVMPEIGH